MKTLIEQAKEYQFGNPGEVIRSNQSVCLSPWSTKAMKPLDPEVLAFAKEHGITVRTEEQYQYACHEFDRVYDAGEV